MDLTRAALDRIQTVPVDHIPGLYVLGWPCVWAGLREHAGFFYDWIATRASLDRFLNHHDVRVQLAVIGGSDTGRLARIIGPHGHPLLRHPECSVLVVRR